MANIGTKNDNIQGITTSSPITVLSGIGAKRASLFSKLGITSVGDLLRHFPRAYQNRGDVKTLLEAQISGEYSSLIVTVGTSPKVTTLKNRKSLLKFSVFDESGRCSVIFFNANFLKDAFELGKTYRLWGKVISRRGSCEISCPDFEVCDGKKELADLFPVYPLTQGLSQKIMRQTLELALQAISNIPEVIPDNIRIKYNLLDVKGAYRAIHTPLALTSIQRGKEYFTFENLLIFALGIAISKQKCSALPAPSLRISKADFKEFLSLLPFEPTGAQKRVINEIASDLAVPFAMHRIVMGDVGSGKTICAAAAAYITIKSGYKCALMAPTEILAAQHYNDLSPLFKKLGIECVLLTGSLSAASKKAVRAEIEQGGADFIIGTHALISDATVLPHCALTICDEQHRFGVAQRAKLSEKAGGSHTLVMSATPIPRTLALALYGDLELSFVDELPPGRVPTSTYLVNENYRSRLNSFIEKNVNEGGQVYIVCPSVEKSEDESEESGLIDSSGNRILPLKDAVSYTEDLRLALPSLNIGYVHGRMSAKDKDAVMSDFAKGEIKVLVSTTVIEVGVNVPLATLMIVENAERFGLSQLHQLRGRVGRGHKKSYCVLVSDSENEASLERLRALCSTADGYKIAEFDLAQRGPGDFISLSDKAERQSGAADFISASLADNMKTFECAFKEAENIISADPQLKGKEYEQLSRSLSALLERRSTTLS